MAENETIEQNVTPAAARISPEQVIEETKRGTLSLLVPMRARGADVNALEYDFSRLTAKDFADAMDMDMRMSGTMLISYTQALALFGKAVGKVMPDIDMHDVIERISMPDAPRAAQVTKDFFYVCCRAGKRHSG